VTPIENIWKNYWEVGRMDDFYVPWDGGERYVKRLEARIAELLESNEEWRLDFASLEAENQRLRDAAQAVVDSATPHYDRWVNGVTRICINRLAALLGGGK
jgi:hypothetical protein